MRTPKDYDVKYMDRLELLYKLAVKKKEAGTAMVLLDKIRNMDLYLDRPAKEPDDKHGV
ncbi:hypothetical protein LCGC14_2923410 [marine sediment metagenome]|uniref:Uncharacterized protein n=1 Tax=marine sediment metagenome TaxID=412755 RepID=A0A0F9AE62_9ZZZZ